MDDKERLRLAKEALGSDSYDKETIEYIFPELKESNDEKIKEDIISYIQLANQFIPQFQKDKWIAWLEKQGKDEYIDPDTLIQQRLDALSDIVADQKPTDKVEPKFKAGDWAVSNLDRKARQISEVHFDEYNSYYVVDGKSVNLEEYDRLHHLWTIQDAKDGDVLAASDKSLFIYDGSINENGSVGFHIAFAEDMNIILNSDDGCGWEEKDSCHPATKEQRDLLFTKMEEAEYEWDAEKKELKKIEQTPTWSEEDEKMIDAIYSCVDSHYDGLAKTSLLIWLKSLKPQNTWKPSDKQLNNLLDVLSFDNCTLKRRELLESLYNDLKKLREE